MDFVIVMRILSLVSLHPLTRLLKVQFTDNLNRPMSSVLWKKEIFSLLQRCIKSCLKFNK